MAEAIPRGQGVPTQPTAPPPATLTLDAIRRDMKDNPELWVDSFAAVIETGDLAPAPSPSQHRAPVHPHGASSAESGTQFEEPEEDIPPPPPPPAARKKGHRPGAGAE
jgi:hypothetical protein